MVAYHFWWFFIIRLLKLLFFIKMEELALAHVHDWLEVVFLIALFGPGDCLEVGVLFY